jgi:hypothetical protein
LSSPDTDAPGWSVLDLFAQLVQRYPVMFWGGLWLGMVLVATVSLVGLLTPSYVKQREQGRSAKGATHEETTLAWQFDLGENAPLWSFAAIAASCAAGSWFLYRQLNQASPAEKLALADPQAEASGLDVPMPTPQPLLPGRSLPAAQARTTQPPMTRSRATRMQTGKSQQTGKPQTMPSQPQAHRSATVDAQAIRVSPKPGKFPQVSPATPTSHSLVVQQSTTASLAPEPRVTVVPEEESHPLDWGEAGLADMMDIRKRRSLSSLM